LVAGDLLHDAVEVGDVVGEPVIDVGPLRLAEAAHVGRDHVEFRPERGPDFDPGRRAVEESVQQKYFRLPGRAEVAQVITQSADLQEFAAHGADGGGEV